jgi:hypothetical protein
VKYYDLKQYWPRVKRHLGDKELNDTLVLDFNKYTWGLWREKFTHGQFPTDFENCDLAIEPGRTTASFLEIHETRCLPLASKL